MIGPRWVFHLRPCRRQARAGYGRPADRFENRRAPVLALRSNLPRLQEAGSSIALVRTPVWFMSV
jgi:hypothetical protein